MESRRHMSPGFLRGFVRNNGSNIKTFNTLYGSVHGWLL